MKNIDTSGVTPCSTIILLLHIQFVCCSHNHMKYEGTVVADCVVNYKKVLDVVKVFFHEPVKKYGSCHMHDICIAADFFCL